MTICLPVISTFMASFPSWSNTKSNRHMTAPG
jgi:hypothetical protein